MTDSKIENVSPTSEDFKYGIYVNDVEKDQSDLLQQISKSTSNITFQPPDIKFEFIVDNPSQYQSYGLVQNIVGSKREVIYDTGIKCDFNSSQRIRDGGIDASNPYYDEAAAGKSNNPLLILSDCPQFKIEKETQSKKQIKSVDVKDEFEVWFLGIPKEGSNVIKKMLCKWKLEYSVSSEQLANPSPNIPVIYNVEMLQNAPSLDLKVDGERPEQIIKPTWSHSEEKPISLEDRPLGGGQEIIMDEVKSPDLDLHGKGDRIFDIIIQKTTELIKANKTDIKNEDEIKIKVIAMCEQNLSPEEFQKQCKAIFKEIQFTDTTKNKEYSEKIKKVANLTGLYTKVNSETKKLDHLKVLEKEETFKKKLESNIDPSEEVIQKNSDYKKHFHEQMPVQKQEVIMDKSNKLNP